jgi:hypothetical protein
MCHKIGMPPMVTMGFGRISVSSARRVPLPPARIATFICQSSSHSRSVLVSDQFSNARALLRGSFPINLHVNKLQ